jgi:hypothetical protein
MTNQGAICVLSLRAFIAVFLLSVLSSGAPVAAQSRYSWKPEFAGEALERRYPPPAGFAREPVEPQSFAEWLRGLPMKSAGAAVLLHTGAPKWRQDVHAGVVDIDVGLRDLQQCADAVMRLRAEWLYSLGRKSDIAFNDTRGKRLRFSSRSKQDYPGFRKYMDFVFAYAGTYSLERELVAVDVDDIRAGDVFIKGGFPGHAVLVADVVANPATGEKRFLLMQSYMPAQSIHVLKNPASADGSPWYPTTFGATLVTPEWRFSRSQLKRWRS